MACGTGNGVGILVGLVGLGVGLPVGLAVGDNVATCVGAGEGDSRRAWSKEASFGDGTAACVVTLDADAAHVGAADVCPACTTASMAARVRSSSCGVPCR